MPKSFIFLFWLFFSQHCFAEQGVTTNKITLGMSNALSGPAAQLGLELKKGSLAYFRQLNKQGGIHGKKVELLSLDDAYEPIHTVANTHQLIAKQVFALFGYVGTPTSHAIMSIIDKKNIPYLMPFTGADFLRTPVKKHIFNLRASYQQEAKLQVDYLVNIKKFTQIALVIQADEFGLAAEKYFRKMLKNHHLVPAKVARYQRNNSKLNGVLNQLKDMPIQAIIFIGTYEPLINLINMGYEQNFNPLYASLSFISSDNVYRQLTYPSQVVVSEVMPDPIKCQWQLCQAFRKDMKLAGYKEINRIQLEGYLNAYVFTKAAQQCKKSLTRSCLLSKLEEFTVTENDLNISFSPENHQGLQQVFLSFSNVNQ